MATTERANGRGRTAGSSRQSRSKDTLLKNQARRNRDAQNASVRKAMNSKYSTKKK